MEDNVSITVNEPVVARPMTSANDVMRYIHGINISREDKMTVGRLLIFEAENEYQADVLKRLDHLATLENNWDGYGASAVSPLVIDNLRSVVAASHNADWQYWIISPESNGALCLQSSKKMSSISLGDNEFSYYSCSPDKEVGEDHVPFTPMRLLGVMRKIA